jgi:NAD(P)H dehydrogenase (quinone)
VIAVTGASGVVGGRTAELLAARGVPLRLVVRDSARAPDVGAEVRTASRYGAHDAMRAAFDGVDTVFLVPAEESEDRVEQHKTAVDAAVAAGVRRIVYLSFVNANPARRSRSCATTGRPSSTSAPAASRSRSHA